MRLRKNRRERLQRRNGEVWGDGDEGYVHYLDCGDGSMEFTPTSKLIKLCISNMYNSVYVNITLIKLFLKKKQLHSWAYTQRKP